ncbi:substrate-binding periplasmic protein [Nocardioides sp. LHG3406-4]|uniref:substrate-binding periplasmic protein n=1 Tax=Nocardioides sp. LHG3406-4 TaxID=2804575 RepID=UPI003CF23B48
MVLLVLVAVVVTVVATRLSAGPARPAKPVLVASGDWEPFVGPDLPDGGPVTRLVTEVLQRMGYAPEIGFTSWPLALQRTADTVVLGTFPFVGSDERREDFLLSAPLLDVDYVLFVRTGERASEIDEPEDLRALDVAHVAGYDYWTELEAAVPQFVEYASKEAAFAALAAGDVDVVPEGLLSGNAVLASGDFVGDSNEIESLNVGDNPLRGSTESLHLMLAPTDENRRLLAEFDRLLAEVRDSEFYDGVVQQVEGETADEEVILQPWRPGGHVVLRDGAGRYVVTTTGTRARVLAWPAAFTEGAPRPPREVIRIQVKVLSGPLTGRILAVDARSLQLRGPS